jgi:hypothetical protein
MKSFIPLALATSLLAAAPAAASTTVTSLNDIRPFDPLPLIRSKLTEGSLLYAVEQRDHGVFCGKIFEPTHGYGVFVTARDQIWIGIGIRVINIWMLLCTSKREDIGP